MKQAGFTLLEILLVITLMALAATAVIPALPSHSAADTASTRLESLLNWAGDRAVEDNQLLGLNVTKEGYQLVLLSANEGSDLQWHAYAAGRVATDFHWPKEWNITIEPAGLNRDLTQRPQILFLPDGQLTSFTLTLADGSGTTWTLHSDGVLPVQLRTVRSQ